MNISVTSMRTQIATATISAPAYFSSHTYCLMRMCHGAGHRKVGYTTMLKGGIGPDVLEDER